jgi:peptidoglycan/LPS O-acetylase OafA/YrhL
VGQTHGRKFSETAPDPTPSACFRGDACWCGLFLFPRLSDLAVDPFDPILPNAPDSCDRSDDDPNPLDGPAWSLFYEYIANFAYALVLRKLSNATLAVLTAVAAAVLIHLGVTRPIGNIVGGWSLTTEQLHIGFSRLCYPFLSGLLLFRTAKPIRFKRFPFWCLILFAGVLVFPRIGGDDRRWLNGLYDALVIILALPIFVLIAAGAEVGATAAKICRFAGGLSFPIYITHYPVMLIYTGWVIKERPGLIPSVGVAAIVCAVSIAMGYAFLRWYDIPVRAWLTKRLLP